MSGGGVDDGLSAVVNGWMGLKTASLDVRARVLARVRGGARGVCVACGCVCVRVCVARAGCVCGDQACARLPMARLRNLNGCEIWLVDKYVLLRVDRRIR